MVNMPAEDPDKLLTRCRSGLHEHLAIMELLVLISTNKCYRMSTGGCLSPSNKFINSMGCPVQGEGHEPNPGPVPEVMAWDEFTPENPEVTISPDASATV